MSKKIITNHLIRAKKDISVMIDMLNNDSNCIDVIMKSKEAQLEIESAKRIIIDSYLEKCAKDWIHNNKQENIDELIKVFNYR